MSSTSEHPATLTLHVDARRPAPDAHAWLEVRFRATDGTDIGITYGRWSPQGVVAGREYAMGLMSNLERTVRIDQAQFQSLFDTVNRTNEADPGRNREDRAARWTRHRDNVLWVRDTWQQVTGERLEEYYGRVEKLHPRSAASLAAAVLSADRRHPTNVQKRPIQWTLFDDNRRYQLPSVLVRDNTRDSPVQTPGLER